MRRIWLVGHGFLGSMLAAQCRARGHELSSIDQSPDTGADRLGDASQTSLWLDLLSTQEYPDTLVLALATRGGDERSYARCYLGVLHAIEEAWQRKGQPLPHLIFCSSTSVCAGTEGACMDESIEPQPTRARGRTLREAELHVQRLGGLVLRLGALYGGSRLELLRRYQQGQMPVAGAMDRWLNYSLREQVVSWILDLIECPPDRATLYHLVTDRLTKAQALHMMQTLTGLPQPADTTAPSRRGSSNHQIMSRYASYASEGFETMRSWVQARLERDE